MSMAAKEAKKGREEETIFRENENPPKIPNKKCAISIVLSLFSTKS
jgi:hypothetical protein